MSTGGTRRDGPRPTEVRERRRAAGSRGRQVAHPGLLAPAAVLLLAPFAARGATIEFGDGTVVLGRTETAAALVRVEEPKGKLQPLRIAVSVGSFAAPERVEPGLWRAAYTPPPTRHPQTAIAAVWREGGPAEAEFVRFPLDGTTRLEVTASPGSAVTVEVAGRSFGPALAGEDGQVFVPLVIPPGARQALVAVRRGKETVRRSVPLEMPEGNRLLAVALRSPGATPSQARLLVAYDGGEGFRPDRIRIEASAGTATREGSSGGIHSFRWAPPPKPPPEVAFTVTVEGDERSRGAARLPLAPPPEPASPRPPATAAAPRPPPGLPPPPALAAPAAPAAPEPGRTFLLGSRAGYAAGTGGLRGPRAGLELWSSLPPAALPVGYGLLLGVGSAARPAASPGGSLETFAVPLSLRLAWELRLGNAFVARLGGGFVAAWALARGTGEVGQGFGHGAAAFSSLSWMVRSAEFFAEVCYGRAPVRTAAGQVDAAGLSLETGFRVGAF